VRDLPSVSFGERNAKSPRLDEPRAYWSINLASTYFRSVPADRLSSALAGLTAVFGMGTGGTPPPWTPET
jgi:hypothetical protein